MMHKTKRTILALQAFPPAWVWLVCLAFLSLPLSSHAGCELPGNGTALSPYLVSTFPEMAQVGDSCGMDATYRLTEDLNSANSDLYPLPIGDSGKPFRGTFHGGGHSIDVWYIGRSGCVGLFGYIEGARIDSLKVDTYEEGYNAESFGVIVGVSGPGSVVEGCVSSGSIKPTFEYLSMSGVLGGIVGQNLGTVRNCHSSVKVIGATYGGGIVGSNGGVVEGCYSSGDITGTYAGGVVGIGHAGSVVKRSYWSGGKLFGVFAGGGVAAENGGKIIDCYAAGNAAGDTIGGIAGYNTGTISNSFWSGTLSSDSLAGGLVGRNAGAVKNTYWNIQQKSPKFPFGDLRDSIGSVRALTGEQMFDSSYFSGFSFDSDSAWGILQGKGFPFLRGMPNIVNDEFRKACLLAGSGTDISPYLVGSYSDLKQVGTGCSLDASYRMSADIDASTSAMDNGGTGLVPIGNLSGGFHGAGHVIKNLRIYSDLPSVGLFTSGVIDSLGLIDVDIFGTSPEGVALGGISGSGSVSYCFTSGRVRGLAKSIGGIIGRGNVSHSYSAANVSGGNGGYIGGIAGTDGTVVNCYSVGKVEGNDSSNVGGLVGENFSIWNSGDGSATGITENSYATGEITGGGAIGGVQSILVGWYLFSHQSGSTTVDGEINNCYWNIQTSQVSMGLGKNLTNAGASRASLQGLTSLEMKDSANFRGFSFAPDSAWTIIQGKSYPLLRGMPGGIDYQVLAQSAVSIQAKVVIERKSRLHRIGQGIELELVEASQVRIIDALGREVFPMTGFVAGTHALHLPKSQGMLFVQIRTQGTLQVLPILPIK